MRTYDTLVRFVKASDRKELMHSLGYHDLRKGEESLNAFLSAGSLKNWLAHGHYDFVHSSESFTKKLASLAGVDPGAIDRIVDKEAERRATLSQLQTPYIFVDTRFRRKNEPIFALAFMEGKRRIALDKETVYDRSLKETLQEVSQIIREHYRNTGGKLKLWGKIHEYRYHHLDGRTFRFDTEGHLIEELPRNLDEGGAVLSVGGKEIPPEMLTQGG